MIFDIAIGTRIRKSPFFEATVAAGCTRFSVYNHMYMPTSYGDPAGEYARLTEGVSLWDVAVERQVEIVGPDAARLVAILAPRDLSRCAVGQGKYVPLCDHEGRLINDPVLLKLAEDRFWLSIADSDVGLWAKAVAAERGLDVRIGEPDVSPLAVQGPMAEAVAASLFGDWVHDLKHFWFRETTLEGVPLVVARSGWSKQGGFELYLRDGARGTDLWNLVWEAGKPFAIGPGAPNQVERIENGLLSYGADTDAETNPFEVRLGRYVDLEGTDGAIGVAALRRIRAAGPRRRQIGLTISGAPLTRLDSWLPVLRDGRRVGHATSAVFSPRLNGNIALALVESDDSLDEAPLAVDTPQGRRRAAVSPIPFV